MGTSERTVIRGRHQHPELIVFGELAKAPHPRKKGRSVCDSPCDMGSEG